LDSFQYAIAPGCEKRPEHLSFSGNLLRPARSDDRKIRSGGKVVGARTVRWPVKDATDLEKKHLIAPSGVIEIAGPEKPRQ
jgi:hypothetical protein